MTRPVPLAVIQEGVYRQGGVPAVCFLYFRGYASPDLAWLYLLPVWRSLTS